MPQQFEFRHLRAIDVLADEGNFGRAADRLHVARPAFSRTIQQLEQRLGVALVDRTTRSVSMTAAGDEFVEHARRILVAADAAVDATEDVAAGRSGLLRIGFSGPAMSGPLPRLLRRLRMAQPQLRLAVEEASTGDQIRALQRGDLDVGFFLAGASLPDDLDTVTAGVDPSVIGVSRDHGFADRSSLRLEELADETVILFPRDRNPTLYDELVDHVSDGGRRRIRIEIASSRPIAAGLVAAGLGVSTFTASMAGMCGPDVVLIPQVDPERSTTVLMGWHHATTNPLLGHLDAIDAD